MQQAQDRLTKQTGGPGLFRKRVGVIFYRYPALKFTQMNKLYVLTGGPGVGKTSLLNAMATDGIATVPEVARAIIKQQLATGGDALPWKNKERYTDLMLAASIQDYRRVVVEQTQRTHFFDRSVIDAVCYAEMVGYSISPSVM